MTADGVARFLSAVASIGDLESSALASGESLIGVILSDRWDFDQARWRNRWERHRLTTASNPYFLWGVNPGSLAGCKCGVRMRMSRRTMARWREWDPTWANAFRRVCFIELRGSPLGAKARRDPRWRELAF